MTILRLVWREFIGLFVDDEFLALAILGVVGLSALAHWLAFPSAIVGAIVLLGCVGVLAGSVWRAKSKG